MTYRDDRDADRARIDALEAELDRTKQELSIARGETALVPSGGNALAVARGEDTRWYGPPVENELRKSYPGEFPAAGFEDLLTRIRSVSRDRGAAEILSKSFTWTSSRYRNMQRPAAVVGVVLRQGKTELVMQLGLGSLAGGIYGGIGGGVGGGAIAAPIAIPAALGLPWLIPIAVAGWLGTVFLGSRAIYKRLARRQVDKFMDLFRVVDTEISEAIARAERATTP